ncbi:hypothetical protein [Sulfurisphaera ohwakuensis]|uniref:DUF5658 domain-containing protein n=1 Tax=Sulfurisphaera ohwakuensis TaxID=69656 RepID=A0A7J9RYW4_SULOH|nr:hypothetical protein [Sulfurisphaera ohwakuensis]MBB5255249.1 hypothetical protein [Sulfurisphaera ohwakuensis]
MSRLLKVLWALFIAGNIYDVIITWIGGDYFNVFEFGNWYYLVSDTVASYNVYYFLALIGIKIYLFVGMYWFLKLFDKFNVSKFKWLGLVPVTLVTLGANYYDTVQILRLYKVFEAFVYNIN